MKESIFNSEIVNSIKAIGGWAYKIPDFPQSMIRGARFNPDKPFDIVASISLRSAAIEGKQFKKFEAFGARHMRPSQIETFDYMIETGSSRPFVFLNIRVRLGYRTPYENRLIIFEWSKWGDRIKSTDSIKKKELEDLPYIRGSRKLFDLNRFRSCIKSGHKYDD